MSSQFFKYCFPEFYVHLDILICIICTTVQGFRAFYLLRLLGHHWIKNYIRKGLFLCIKPLIWHSILLKSEKSPRFFCFRQLKLLFSRSKISFGSTWFEISLSVSSIVIFIFCWIKAICAKKQLQQQSKNSAPTYFTDITTAENCARVVHFTWTVVMFATSSNLK